MDEFLGRFATDDDDETELMWVQIVGAHLEDADLVLDLVYTYDVTTREEWRVRCVQVQGHEIDLTGAECPILTDDHVVLAPYVEPRYELYTYERALDPERVAWDLYVAHEVVAQGWFPFPWKGAVPYVLRCTWGSLGDGPKRFIEAYETALTRHGIRTSILGPLDGSPEPGPLRALLMGSAWVVAEGFEAERRSGIA